MWQPTLCIKLVRFFFHSVRPLEVEILFNNQPLSADRQYEVECQAIGSRPPSVITWWMNGIALVAQPTKVNWFFIARFSFALLRNMWPGEEYLCNYLAVEKVFPFAAGAVDKHTFQLGTIYPWNCVNIEGIIFLTYSFHYEFIDISRWQRNDINVAVHANQTRQWQELGVSGDQRAG